MNKRQKPPKLEPIVIIRRAIAAANSRGVALLDGFGVFNAMFSHDGKPEIKINADSLEWLIERCRSEASGLLEELEYAERYLDGETLRDADERYAEGEAA